jgi:hypothetical protein
MMKKGHPEATWIWYPGDFEIWLGNKFNNRRTERGAMFPPFWKQDSHWPTVEFCKSINLQDEEQIKIYTEGSFHLMIDGKLQFGMPPTMIIPKGKHHISIKVHNQSSPPSLYIDGSTIHSDGSWLTTYEDKIWIDENGIAHGSGIYVPSGRWNFDDPHHGPSTFSLPRQKKTAASLIKTGKAIMADFGQETMGYLLLKGVHGEGTVKIFYGESHEEASDHDHCETLDVIDLRKDHIIDLSCNAQSIRHSDYTLRASKAFRYVSIEADEDVTIDDVAMEYEYAPYQQVQSGSFTCNDAEVNQIWKVSAYTMDLTTREFFTDGIKRDRWIWSGDAIQSYLMNYYLRFDNDCVRRTIRQLRGKDPVTAHINTIMDYTFYWFKSIHDYYCYTGDHDFLREMYPRMVSLMDYCLSRTNADGMMEGQSDDWIFVDWVDFPMHKRGVLCFEQILFCKSLETMEQCATVLGQHPVPHPPQGSIPTEIYRRDAHHYATLATSLRQKIQEVFWDPERHAYLHAMEEGEMNRMVTKFPNMMAIIYDFATDDQRQEILHHVMFNPMVESITTPYMRFYELEALCMMGHQEAVLSEIKAYWGGMLQEGATTFWEKYVPTASGREHLEMYGRPYGKSLCHAWGASPIYLFGRYFLGVSPVQPGYEAYEVRPHLGGLEWMEGDVPTPWGMIHVYMDENTITVKSNGGHGKLIIHGHSFDIHAHQPLTINKEDIPSS